MSFTFLHTADWQIGKAFRSMPADVAAALADARLDAIDRLAEAATAAGARHVLVAGDVFDSLTLSPKTVRQALARIARHPNLTWHMLPGNHDAHRPGGLWERLAADDPPGNMGAHLAPGPTEIEPGVFLLPAPLTGRAASLDPTAYYDAAGTPKGVYRIGLAHGSVQGFGSSGDAAINIAPGRAASAGLDYLALGDWHGAKEINARTWYAGTPEPDRFTDNEPGHALIVRLETPGVPAAVEKVRIGRYVWQRRELELRGADDLAALEQSAARPGDVLLQLVLTGRVTAGDRQAIARRLARLEAELRHLDADVSALTSRAGNGDLEALGASRELRQLGERLAASPLPEAADALALLLDLAADAGSGAP
jgi:DNA repair exonuclease SbcCD nuclease subunit